MRNNLFVILSFISLFVLSGAVGTTPTNEYGPIPKTFCDPVDFEELTLIGTDVKPVGTTAGVAGGFPFTLTPNAAMKAGALWYNNQVNLYNGFISEFTLSFTTEYTCTADGTRCGGEGIAFVLQQTGMDALGSAGSGMGYAGLKNVLAVEFDTMYDAQTNDPALSLERHISIIIKKDTAEANEVASYGYNPEPFNFKNDKSENYISSPTIRVEYLNNNLRVFINDVLQLAYYNPLNLVDRVFATTNPLWNIGFTASTGQTLSQQQIISYWNLKKVQSDADHSNAVIVTAPAQIVAGQNFDVKLTIKDRCANFFYTNDLTKLQAGGFGDSNQSCKVVAKKSIIETSLPSNQVNFLVTFNCTVNKENFLSFKWYNDGAKSLRDFAKQPTPVIINAAPLSNAYIIWTDFGYLIATNGQSPKTDANSPLRFTVVPRDAFGNEVAVDQAFINSITVTWPDKTTNKAKVPAPVVNGNRLVFTVNVDVAGTYTVTSPWFTRTFAFIVEPGTVNAANSIAYLGDAKGAKFSFPSIKAGSTDVYLYLVLRDSASNLIPVNITDIDNQVNAYGVEWNKTILNNSYVVQTDSWGNSETFRNNTIITVSGTGVAQYKSTPFRAGTVTYQAWVRGVAVPFQPNSLTVVAGDFCSSCPDSWKYVEVWPWNIQTNAFYRPTTPDNIIIYRKGAFQSLVITTDIYYNPIYRTTDFTLTLSGQLMYPITMCGAAYNTLGSAHTLCAATGREADNYNSLVQRDNYTLSVNLANGTVLRNVRVNLVTFADDSGCGNGPWIPENTIIYNWWSERTLVRCTNSFSDERNVLSFGVQIRNAEKKRTNRWFVKSQNIKLNTTAVLKTTEQFIVRQAEWTGVYIIYYVSQSPEYQQGGRKMSVQIDKSEIYAANGLGLWPDEPTQYKIKNGGARLLADSTATNDFVSTSFSNVVNTIHPNGPAYGYIVDTQSTKLTASVLNSFGNYTANITVDNAYVFNIAVFDIFNNPTWFENPNWFRVQAQLTKVQFQNTYDAYTLAPTCISTATVGFYNCTLSAIRAGEYTISSPIFRADLSKLAFNSYSLYIAPGKPTVATSYAEVDLSGKTYFLATETVKFFITPKDQFLNLLPPDQTIADSWFELLAQIPGNVSYVPTNVKAIGDLVTGRRIQFTFQLNVSGITIFKPTLQGTPLGCTYCSVTVKPNVPNWLGSQIQVLVDGKWTLFDSKKPLQLDNFNKVPSFYLAISDIAGNLVGEIPKGWEKFAANLKHPRFQAFPLNGLPYQNGVNYALDQIYVKNYSMIVWDNSWTLSFDAYDGGQAKTVSVLVSSVTTLGQGNDTDSKYDSAAIDVSKSTVSSAAITVKAGSIGTFIVETRTNNGKLKKSFYDNGVQGNIDLDAIYMFQKLEMVRGTSYGTYAVNFNITDVGTYNFRPKVRDSTGVQSALDQTVTVTVIPNDVYTVKFANRAGLVLNDTHFYEKTVDDTVQFVMTATDFWKNPITDTQPKALGITLEHATNANANSPSPISVKKSTGANFVIALAPRTIGNYNFQYIDQAQKGGVVDLILPIAVGAPSPTDSLAEVLKSKLKPTEDAFIYVFPTDKFRNSVPPSVVNTRFPNTRFGATVKYPGATGITKDLGNADYNASDPNAKAFFFTAKNLTQTGEYTFTTYWGDSSKQTNYVSRVVTVESTEANFFSMKLNVKDPSTQNWVAIPRVDDPALVAVAPKPIQWDPVAKPQFQMDMRDRYNNQITIVPSNWTTSLRLVSINDTAAEPIFFCYDKIVTFYFCAKNESLQDKKLGSDPAKLWALLVTTNKYHIELSNGKDIYQANWTFVPNPSDEGASDNRLDITKTVISPQNVYTTTAGQAITFNVELRATDNKRKKVILDDPAQNISLVFAQDNDGRSIVYKVAPGQLLGQFIVTVIPTKTYPITAPNQITFVYNEARYVGFQPLLVSNPAKPADIFVQGFFKTENAQMAKAVSVDSKYQFTIQAVDIYNNTAPLAATSAASVKIVDPAGNTVPVTQYINQGTFITSTFQPTIVGTYNINVDQRHNYTIDFTNGVPSSDVTTYTTRDSLQIAGVENKLNVTVLDQFGNNVPVDALLAQNFTGFFNLQNTMEQYVLFNPTIDRHTVSYSFTPNITGVYEFSFAYKNKEAICKSCSAIVKPAALSFNNTSFQYYSPQASKLVTVSKTASVVEDNRNSLPLYGVVLRDVFGNALGSTPSDYKINAVLTGGINAVVEFNTTVRSDGTMTFDLPVETIVVGGTAYASVSDYWAALLSSKQFYTLAFTDGTNTYNQSVMIKGNGDNDLDASNEDFSIANTVISKTALSTVAHQYVSFFIETRTIDNRRKANFLNAVINVTFDKPHASHNYTVIPSDKFGVYVVSVITDKAYKAEDNQSISFSVNGSTYATKLSLVVVPAPLYYSVIVEAQNGVVATLNATEKQSFSVVGTDEYRNIIDGITAETVTLQTYMQNAPENRVNPKFEFTQTKNSVEYAVDARYAGGYLIASPMFKAPQYYAYTVLPAQGSAANSILTVSYGSDLPLRANVSVQVVLSVFDKYDNQLVGKDIDFASFNITLIGSTGASYRCNPTTKDHWKFVNCTVYPTVADDYVVVVAIYGQPVPSSGYTLKINPGPIDISRTAFFKDVAAGLSVAVTNHSVQYETEGFTLEARFRDYWGNTIQSFDTTDAFKIQLFGNDMDTINLVESRTASIIRFSTSDADAPWFKRLVPATGYTILAVYSRDNIERGNATLPFSIDGETIVGAGNGKYDPYFTNVSSTTVSVTAGFTSSFTIELRTKQNNRYNGPIAADAVIVKPTDGNSEGLVINTLFTGTNGVWAVTVNSTKAYTADAPKQINIFVEGKDVARYQLQLIVLPAFPTKFTLVSKDLTGTTLPEEVPTVIKFKLFDQYGNAFSDRSVISKLKTQSTSGNVKVTDFTQGGNNFEEFNLAFIPYFPPQETDIDVLLTVPGSDPAQNSLRSVLGKPFTFKVSSVLDTRSTDIVGGKWMGVAVDVDMDFTVLARNKKLFCYADDANVSVIFHGPYASYTVGDKKLVASALINHTALVTTNSASGADVMGSNPFIAKACTKYYSVYVPAGTLKKAGIYQIEVSVNGISAIVKRQTVMRAGQISEANTEALIPTGYGNAPYGKTPISLVAASTFSFQIQLYDQFDNIITYDNGIVPASFNFGESVSRNDFSAVVLNNRNGSYAVTVNITQEGTYNQFTFVVNSVNIVSASMYNTGKLNNFPSYIEVTPGFCSAVYPITPNFTQNGGVILVGTPNSFLLKCADKFNNQINVTKPEAQFTVLVLGTDLDVVGTDVVYPKVTAVKDGQYEVSFSVAWSGNYAFRIQLRQAPYITVNYKAQYSICPDATPYFCENVTATKKGGCVAGPLECTFPEITYTGEKSTPFLCPDYTSHVKALELCPCVSKQTKCPVTGRCAAQGLASSLFPDVAKISCPEGTVKCEDGSCRSSKSNCPSLRTCAPGFFLCPDLQCAKNENECTAQFSTCPPPGDSVRLFKCWDQSCAASIDSCPTRTTCPVVGQVSCEGVCVDNALQCKQPSKCTGKLALRCADGSCARKTSDCPATKSCGYNLALCADGTCRDDCSPTLADARLRRMLDSDSPALYTKYVCPSGDVVPSQYNCPSAHVCGSGKIQCTDGSCVTEISQCPHSSCPTGNVECWDGKCETDIKRCSTRTTCPDELPTLCSDGSCKSSAAHCTDYVECPIFSPFRCGSGECRVRKEDCSTLVTCPPGLPVKCPDESCVRSKIHCASAASNVCAAGSFRCADGSCAASKSLCPTLSSCPAGYIRCFNNECQKDLSSCPAVLDDTITCAATAPVRCPDGSCRVKSVDCPTPVVCPLEKPVLCDDGNCRESSNECFTESGCVAGTKRCPDGACVGATDACGTPITCPAQAPYKCLDMTCKRNPSDCPSIAECPLDSPIRCGDGTCKSRRIYCRALSACPAETPVRCPDMISCVDSRDKCPVIQSCPAGFVQCDDGSCSISILSCPSKSCPIHLAFKCPDGFCVSDASYCSDTTTGCPASTPFKCQDGSCVLSSTKCGAVPTCSTGQTLCKDGSCSKNCGSLNQAGCSLKEIKCTNGQCVDPSKGLSCPVASCPTEKPAKCLDGQCVTSLSNCLSAFNSDDFSVCAGNAQGNFVPCADGTCAASAEQCRPILPCANLFVRCNDGSCRPTSEQCPVAKTCPETRSYRCPSGICVVGVEWCPSESDGCPASFGRRCEKTGQCISSKTENVLASLGLKRTDYIDRTVCNGTECDFCNEITDENINQAEQDASIDKKFIKCKVSEDICNIVYEKTSLSNGCNFLKPFKCANNKCVSALSQCDITNNCPADKFMCFDNSCADTADACKAINNDCSLQLDNKFQCPDNKCVKDPRDCKTKDGCPVATPYKCADGKCYASPLNRNGEGGCSPSIQCPAFKPYVCADGECVGDAKFCQIELPCPIGQVRCNDRSCATTADKCDSQRCPPKRPILCSSGACVEKAVACQQGSTTCPESKPFRCAVGVCVSAPAKCDVFTSTGTTIAMRRILERLLEDGSVVNPGCTTASPYKCADGSCRANQDRCPLLASCSEPSKPYRCGDGSCAASKKTCIVQTPVCATGLQACADGICRQPGSCPAFNGCPLTKPLQCSNGYCASTLAECAGHSDCPLSTPFRCANNKCVSDMTKCARSVRTFSSEDIAITISPVTTTEFAFMAEPGTTQTHATLLIPSGALLPPTTTTGSALSTDNSVLEIRPVPQSKIQNLNNTIDETRYTYTNNLFPLSDAKLGFYQSVRSAVFSLKTIGRDSSLSYRFPLFLTLDFEPISEDTTDYCLAQANFTTGAWKCLRNNTISASNKSNEYTFSLTQDGTYAVVFNPERREASLIAAIPTWWDQHKGQFFLWGSVTIASVVIFSFVLWRMIRYVAKYRGSKHTMKKFKAQIEELQTQSTDILGQSLRDKVEGIVFVVNPMHEKHEKPDLSSDIKEMEKALSKLDERDKQLEADNQSLQNRNKILEKELGKLKEQFAK